MHRLRRCGSRCGSRQRRRVSSPWASATPRFWGLQCGQARFVWRALARFDNLDVRLIGGIASQDFAMNKYLKADAWCIVEEGFDPDNMRSSESIFSIGNGRFGQRANFEEGYSGDHMLGSYVGGVYYPDRPRWAGGKTGTRVLRQSSQRHQLDPHRRCGQRPSPGPERRKVHPRIQAGSGHASWACLQRTCTVELQDGAVKLETERFISMASPNVGGRGAAVTPTSRRQDLGSPTVVGWRRHQRGHELGRFLLAPRRPRIRTHMPARRCLEHHRKNRIHSGLRTGCELVDGATWSDSWRPTRPRAWCLIRRLRRHWCSTSTWASSALLHATSADCRELALNEALDGEALGYLEERARHEAAWADIWSLGDIRIEGDVEAQQAIRFNIFHLNQTYRGDDARLNVGPKGFTGEKYGGASYWDTEAYCLPFFLATHPEHVAEQLLGTGTTSSGKPSRMPRSWDSQTAQRCTPWSP